VWRLPSESSTDSFPRVQAYYFVVGASSPDSSRFHPFLAVEQLNFFLITPTTIFIIEKNFNSIIEIMKK
jgi:hypothetical protein